MIFVFDIKQAHPDVDSCPIWVMTHVFEGKNYENNDKKPKTNKTKGKR